MSSRDEYLEKFKKKLDEWNAEVDKLESHARQTQADARAQYDKQLESLREMRDDAQKKYIEMQEATAEAWDAMMQGSEMAWKTWMNALENARSKFMSKD